MVGRTWSGNELGRDIATKRNTPGATGDNPVANQKKMIAIPFKNDITYSQLITLEKGVTMIGGIYSDQRCPVCEGKFIDDGKRGLFCKKHPKQRVTKFIVRFKNICKRFSSYDKAQRFLTGVRFEVDHKKFDQRDYQKDQPLGFENLASKYLDYKAEVSSPRTIRYHLEKASDYFHNRNIKTIGYADLEDFIFYLPKSLSGKTKKNILTTLHALWMWLRKRQIIKPDQFPEFPPVQFELAWRKIVDKGTQQAIIEEVKRITERNSKIHLGIKWLATYISIRPSELLNIKEGDFDFNLKGVWIRKPKEKKPKFVPFLEEDLATVKSYPTAFPHLYFFRHGKGWGGVTPGSKMGRDCLWKAWHKACLNLGIEGVDLYGGTKHSSATDLRKYFSPEQIKRATMHSTNKAFERYFQVQTEDIVKMYQKTADTVLIRKITPIKKCKLPK
jgi:integrase